jgi:hypothetical protein
MRQKSKATLSYEAMEYDKNKEKKKDSLPLERYPREKKAEEPLENMRNCPSSRECRSLRITWTETWA